MSQLVKCSTLLGWEMVSATRRQDITLQSAVSNEERELAASMVLISLLLGLLLSCLVPLASLLLDWFCFSLACLFGFSRLIDLLLSCLVSLLISFSLGFVPSLVS
jgi:hypothetical protein